MPITISAANCSMLIFCGLRRSKFSPIITARRISGAITGACVKLIRRCRRTQGTERARFREFLKFHVEGHYSSVARQHRFDRLFFEAHEVLLSRDRQHYVLDHLKNLTQKKTMKPFTTMPVAGRKPGRFLFCAAFCASLLQPGCRY